MAPHSSTLAWKIPWADEPGGLQSMGSWRIKHDWATSLSLFTFMHWRRKWQPISVFLPGESQGWGSQVGCRLWGGTVGHDWSDLAAAAATLECLVFKGEESTWQCGRPPPGVAQPRLQLHFHFMSLLSLHVIIGWHDWRILNSTLMSINLCLCTYIFHITIQHLF